MNRLNLCFVAFFLGCFFNYFPLSAQSQIPFAESKTDKAKRMSWWTQDRFGMFLHWGLYSQTAGDWKGKPTKGGEHFMLYERIQLKEYAKIADDFNPVKYNADHWVKVARDAGMKYIVITAKHHDGFAMYNSASSDYNIVKRTPFAKDPMKDLAAACKKYGLKLCFYYSLGRDWEDPDVPTNWPVKAGRSNTWDYPNEDAKVLSKYFERKVKPQVKELLTQYGPIGVIWFDTSEMITKQQSIELKNMIHNIQPNCIVNSRIGNGQGDFSVSEQEIIDKANVYPWESCVTISSNWGYNKHDTAWKSPEVLVRQLVEVVSKGGNYLLNIGPKGDGSFPVEAEQRLAAVGKWMKINSEGIYGTQAWKVSAAHIIEPQNKEGMVNNTMKDAVNDATLKNTIPEIRFIAKGNDLFVAVCSWKDPKVPIKILNNKDYTIKSVRLLGYTGKLDWQQNGEGLSLTMPEKLVREIPVYLFKLELASR
jgi:alpha-L-fucosidase